MGWLQREHAWWPGVYEDFEAAWLSGRNRSARIGECKVHAELTSPEGDVRAEAEGVEAEVPRRCTEALDPLFD
jgi:hypothetical protein